MMSPSSQRIIKQKKKGNKSSDKSHSLDCCLLVRKVGYGSLVKFLSRGKWDSDAVAQRLIKLLQQRFDNYVYVYDETRAIKTGEKQFGLHFFRNHRYQKRNTNQSKLRKFGALGLLCRIACQTFLLNRLLSMMDNSNNVEGLTMYIEDLVITSLIIALILFCLHFAEPLGKGN